MGDRAGDRNISLETLDKIITTLEVSTIEVLDLNDVEITDEENYKRALLEAHRSLLIGRRPFGKSC